jgi:hypothetical protein
MSMIQFTSRPCAVHACIIILARTRASKVAHTPWYTTNKSGMRLVGLCSGEGPHESEMNLTLLLCPAEPVAGASLLERAPDLLREALTDRPLCCL